MLIIYSGNGITYIDLFSTFIQISETFLEFQLPNPIRERYFPFSHSTESLRLYVRESYQHIYEIIKESMMAPKEGLKILVTGVPGIGKSMLLLYIIFRFMNDESFSNQPFAFHFALDRCVVFRPQGEGIYSMEEITGGKKTDLNTMLVLIDLMEVSNPQFTGRYSIIFSSPNPARYKEFMKGLNSMSLLLPTWSEEELCMISDEKEEWYEGFVTFGGVPRLVFGRLTESLKSVEDSIISVGSDMVKKFMETGHGGLDADISYKLVHINPPVKDRVFDYRGRRVFSFASDVIFKKLAKLYQNSILEAARGIFNEGVISREMCRESSAGVYFEKIVLWLQPLSGVHRVYLLLAMETSSMKRKVATDTESDITVAIPSDTVLLPPIPHKSFQLKASIHYKPRISNMESGNSFFVLPAGEGSFKLFVLQITVAEVHPVKMNGLLKIIMKFPESIQRRLVEISLIFVTPVNGTLTQPQALITQTVEGALKAPAQLRNVRQFCLRYSL